MKINKIIITGDIFRPSFNSKQFGVQSQNIQWLYHLIRAPLNMACHFPIHALDYSGIDNSFENRFFKARGMVHSFESWVAIYNESQLSSRELAIIAEEFRDAFVIGFEIPDFICNAFDAMEIPYIDFTIHPARFMDDLIFGVRSNLPYLADCLQAWVVFDHEIQIHAGLAMASLARLKPIPECRGLEDAALFCGQTCDDKVLIRGNALMKSTEFMHQFEQICDRHTHVFIKPHPLAQNNPSTKSLECLFPNTHVVTNNFYHICIQESITTIYSITSSTSIEAAYFGKNGVHLSRYPYEFSEKKISGGCYLTIQPHIYDPNFWNSIFVAMGCSSPKKFANRILHSRSTIRKTLRCYWGADIFENI